MLLWVDFAASLVDPKVINHPRIANTLVASYGFILDAIHSFAGLLTNQVSGFFTFVKWYDPSTIITEGVNGWFPICTAKELDTLLSGYGMQGTIPPNFFDGAIIVWIPMTLISVKIVAFIVACCWPSISGQAWFFITEYGFQGKKLKRAKEALDEVKKRNEELESQKRSLTQEKNVLKDTVITDELTKVFNRRFFLERINMEFEQHQRQRQLLSLIMMDIDYFKKLNDTYGHVVGDQVLKVVSGILRENCPANAYPCRYGGEEFAIILPGYDNEKAYRLGESISRLIQRQRFPQIDTALHVTLSQGICTVDFSTESCKELNEAENMVELADQQLYKSKLDGRNRISSKLLN